MATVVKPIFFLRTRIANRTSRRRSSNQFHLMPSRHCSLNCSAPPNRRCAAKRASSGDRPSAILFCVRCSTWSRISSAISVSSHLLRNGARTRFRNSLNVFIEQLRRRHDFRHSRDEAIPRLLLGIELFAASFGEAIVLCATVVVRLSPLRIDPALVLHAVQGGI